MKRQTAFWAGRWVQAYFTLPVAKYVKRQTAFWAGRWVQAWFKSYLYDRFQTVSVNNIQSNSVKPSPMVSLKVLSWGLSCYLALVAAVTMIVMAMVMAVAVVVAVIVTVHGVLVMVWQFNRSSNSCYSRGSSNSSSSKNSSSSGSSSDSIVVTAVVILLQ